MIKSNGDTSRFPKELLSSSPRKLKRPPFNHIHKTTVIPRGDVYDIAASPERNMDPSSGGPRREPLRKSKRVASPRRQQRRIRTVSRRNMLNTDATSDRLVESHSTMNRAQQNHVLQEPPKKRQKLDRNSNPAPRYQLRDSAPNVPDQVLAQSTAPTSTGGERMTRSMKKSSLTSLDLTKPLRPRSKQIVQVLITNTASVRSLSGSAAMSNQPKSLQSSPVIASDANLTAESSAESVVDVRDQDRDHTNSAHPGSPVASPEVVVNDSQSLGVEEDQRESHEDSALFEPYTSPTRDARSQAELLTQDVQQVHEQYNTDNLGDESEDDAPHTEDLEDEINDWKEVLMPKQLVRALEDAHRIHRNAENIWQEFDGIRILKRYDNLKKTVSRWRAAGDYSQTDELIKLSNRITREARTILTKPAWDRHKGLQYIYKRVLPTLVRTLYISLAYYLTEVKTIKRMTHAQPIESRSVAGAIVDLAIQAREAGSKKHTCPRDVVSMVARIKELRDVVDRYLRDHQQAESRAESVQRQQTQRLRQEAVDREDRNEGKLREWRQRWRVLHDQRLGAELEGRTFLSRNDNHLRQFSLDNPYVASPYWDPDTHVYYLAEGLQEFAGTLALFSFSCYLSTLLTLKGPHVYRDIFRKYCRHDGPLRDFNVVEIVDKAVSLKQQLVKMAEEDDEEVDPWVESIFDPRVQPEGLRRDESRY
jgi:hypothetical protein